MMFVHSSLLFTLNMIRVMTLTSSGQEFTKAMRKAKSLLNLWQKSLLKTKLCDKSHREIEILTRQIEDSAEIHPYNCFTLSYASQVSGFSVLLTFAFVLFQFRSSDISETYHFSNSSDGSTQDHAQTHAPIGV